MDNFNDMQTVKRRFFAMRNGVLADRLRKAGSPFQIIFGLNLPQLEEIAADFRGNVDLAERLWENRTTRESRLIAPMMMAVGDIDRAKAVGMLADVEAAEVADILCHRLLRHHPEALEIAREAARSESDFSRYGAVRLAMNIVAKYPDEAEALARAEMARNCALTSWPCRQIIEETDFLRS